MQLQRAWGLVATLVLTGSSPVMAFRLAESVQPPIPIVVYEKWGYGRSRDWSRRQRLQLDSLEMGGHAFMDWWERFGDAHPEYFALLPDGRRAPYGRNVKYIKMCESNPGAINWSAVRPGTPRMRSLNPENYVAAN